MWPFSKKTVKFKPTKADRELMESVAQRLSMFGSLERPVGTEIRSIPGGIVRFLPLAGGSVPTVFEDGTNRPIGSVTSTGEIVYVQPRK